MNDELLETFLAGKTGDREGQICEDYLTDPKNVINCDETAIDDSLLNALRESQDFDLVDEEQLRLLTERIEQLVPMKAFRIGELRHFFDQPVVSTDLGRIGKYRIVEFIASGGSSFVFRAIDTDSDESRCIKLLKPDNQFNKESVARFEQESIEAAKLDHERIVQVLDHGNQNGLPWLAMPMLPGCSLRQWLDKNETVELSLALHITRKIAEGLKFAHQRSILHRDIKPDNLWIDENNNVKILDFGLAKMHDGSPPITHQGTVVGTPSYMSPEQVKGNNCDPRSDLFSLGVVLLEMLCGQSPFKKSSLFSTLISVAGEQLEVSKFDKDSKIPHGVREVISELVQIDPEKRICSAEQLIGRIDALIAAPQHTIDLPKSQSSKNSKRAYWIRAVAALVVAGLILSAGFAVWNTTDKGTLVVETDDPEVVVKIAKQAVSVHDPVSGKNFRIKIGETPLASGVYHLELQDSTSDLIFSSNKIAIRRGEKSIVRVSLITSPESSKTTQEKLSPEADGFDVPLKDWVDQSRDATVGENFSNFLPAISSIAPIHGDQNAFSYYANVLKPVALKTIDSWSIELRNDPLRQIPRVRSNKSMHCTLNKIVRVLEDDQLKYILPIRGRPTSATFDESYPQLLAVCASASNADLGDKSKRLCEITIWRLGNESAELIYRLLANNQWMHWDQGYRLFFDQDGQLSVLRLDTGKTHRLGKISFDSDTATLGGYPTRCFSPNQRFLARYATRKDKSYVKIWDLARGRISSSIPIKNTSSAAIYWRNDSQQIAISYRNNDHKRSDYFRIWKTDESTQLEIVNKYEDQRLAQFKQIPKISTSRTKPSKISNSDFIDFAERMVHSSLTDKEIRREIKTYVSNWPGLANEDGEDERLQIALEKFICFRKDHYIDRNKLLKIQRIHCSTTDHLTIYSKPRSPRDGQLSATNLNLKTGNINWARVIDPSVSWGKTYLINRQEVYSSPPKLSIKDHRFLLADRIIENTKSRKANSRATDYYNYRSISDLRKGIYDIKNGKWIFDFGQQKNNRQHLSAWSSDGRFAAIGDLAKTRRQQDQTLKIYDAQKNEAINSHELGLPIKSVLQIQPFRAGFLVFLKSDDAQTANSGWLIDPHKKTVVKTTLFDEFSSVSILSIDANIVWFRGRRPTDNWDDQSVERQSVHYYMAKITDDKLDILHHETSRERDGYQFSPDGCIAASWKIDGIKRSSTIYYDSLVGGELKFYSWNPDRISQPVKLLKTVTGRPGGDFLWHPQFRTATWSKVISISDSSLRLLKRDSLTVKKNLLEHIGPSFFADAQQFQASRFGWAGVIDNQIIALDPEGQFLGRLLFEPQTDNGIAREPSWILADGSTLTKAPTNNMVIAFVKNKRVYCQPLDQFNSDSNNPKLPKFDSFPMLEK